MTDMLTNSDGRPPSLRAPQSAGRVTFIVKALNEEDTIESCLRSALAGCADVGGDVILVDSNSTDRTVDIARRFPIRIVQFARAADRGCGAAVQLGYQYARGDFLYILDADMELQPGFLRRAIDYFAQHEDVAGVAGRLIDTRILNAGDRQREVHFSGIREPRDVATLGGGGLYRRRAIATAGYCGHRWLPACEEAELGARLRSFGWRLTCLPDPAVTHTGHNESTWRMLRRLWLSRRMQAYGMFLRSAVGKPWFGCAMRESWFVFIAPLVHVATLAGAMVWLPRGEPALPTLAAAEFVAWLSVLATMTVRKKSLTEALATLASWHLYSLATVRGFVRRVGNPMTAIPGRIVK